MIRKKQSPDKSHMGRKFFLFFFCVLPAGEERARLRRRCPHSYAVDVSFRSTAAIAVEAPWSPGSKSTWYHLSACVCIINYNRCSRMLLQVSNIILVFFKLSWRFSVGICVDYAADRSVYVCSVRS